MYRKAPYLFVLCVLLLLVSVSLKGQKASPLFKSKLVPELEIGIAVPVDAEFSDVFALGFQTSVAGAVAVGTPKFIVKPVVGLKVYSKQVDETNNLTENFRTWKAGLELQYQLLQLNKLNIGPMVRVDHNWSADYFSQEYYYGYGPNNYQVAKSENFFSGKGLSTDVGLLARFNLIYLKLYYELYKPTLDVSESIIQEAYNQGFIVEPTKKFNLSSVNLTIGASLNF